MQEDKFRVWLGVERKLNAGSVGSRVSNCKRVEYYEGDLDDHYDTDRLASLMDGLNPASPEHNILINGSVYNGTATLRSAVGLYRQFRHAGGEKAHATEAAAKQRLLARRTGQPAADWPVWPTPGDQDLLELARAMTPFVQFLDPGIVLRSRRTIAAWGRSGLYGLRGSASTPPSICGKAPPARSRGFDGTPEAPRSRCSDDGLLPTHCTRQNYVW